MGRRKQSKPQRSGGLVIDETDQESHRKQKKEKKNVEHIDKPYYVTVIRVSEEEQHHFDVAEVVLTNFSLRDGGSIEIDQDLDCSLRFRLCNVANLVDRIKLGHWPVLSSSDVTLELVDKKVSGDVDGPVIWSASFDGPGEGVSGLAHLASIKFLSLRLVPGDQGLLSPRVRVELLQQAFDACESLLENTRQIWKKSMIQVMSWLRPEVMTSETRYGTQVNAKEIESSVVPEAETLETSKQSRFDAGAFYEAIKPSKMDAMLEDDITDLLPELRPYQRRAAYWMVQRERGDPIKLGDKDDNQFISPLSISVGFLDSASKMFFNPFSGNISLAPEYFSPRIPGGILADEMGLGKTVELLACIFSHRKPAEDDILMSDINVSSVTDDGKTGLKRLKRERVECVCGAVSESHKYKGVWVQCDLCDAWQHADCVGYSPKGKGKKSCSQDIDEKVSQKKSKKDAAKIVVRQGEYICQMCSELLQVTASPISTGATLIVCPAPILPQWHSEITRHTRLGSLVTCIYEGVRNASLSEEPVVDITELLNADIVLTTYDVLKEDLTHDHDRHDGDRHCLRFQKRYPVIPTPLTRIFWWRICLDEAQMVESNAAAATEMALRLYTRHRWCITGTPIQRKLDDLFGLLRFLKANPFDVSRWWTEVIREPYERRDAKAMEFTHKFFKQVMWRSSKVHVADELQLPPQEECISWLKFSAIEEHFYSRQHETCVSYAREVIETLKRDILKRGHTSSDNPLITHAEASKLLNSLLKLRQACCHPQVGSSGLRSLQQTPMTMEEILMVLVKKTQNEGEEALRMLIVALNGIAAIAMLKQEFSEAVSLYKEALNISEEHTEDFRLDPLLHIHILHNLVEILPLVESYRGKKSASGSPKTEIDVTDDDHHRAAKRQRINDPENLNHVSSETAQEWGSTVPDPGFKKDGEYHEECKTLDIVCDTLKVKYLSTFNSKHSAAQQEFRKSYSQVTESLRDMEKQSSVWWLDALQLAEQNKDFSSGLTRKIEETIHGSSSRESSRFRTIHGMKLHLQTCVDMLEKSRKKVIDKLLEIDQTMENPKLEDIELIGNCKNCKLKEEGPTCTHCELDELFKEYEARLFRINKSRGAGMELASAEEILDLQKKNYARNLFFTGLSSGKRDLNAPHGDNKEPTKRGQFVDRVVRSASPSETEIVLGVIRNHCKTYLDREGKLAATKHLHTLEVMRKEYAHARLLARTQAHILRAYDEIKMATMRLQLRESEDDTSIYALSLDELDAASVHNTNDKFLAQSSLLSIKGKLRYLKGLIQAKQKQESESPDHSLLIQEQSDKAAAPVEQNCDNILKPEEACPICHENLRNQKMVFQCGHSTCCKCFFAMTERRSIHDSQQKWVMCPICRQHTDVRNIAYADDRRNCSSSDQVHKENEASLAVHGSYGTKIEAVTRRILWIKSSDPKAKVLVFSSWKDVLDVLEHAFAANGITFIRMKGGRKSQTAISKFKETNQKEAKSIQVLLLLVQHGANGLNLLEAQHVVLVEPLLNPAAEAQAVGRVHRIGQEKPTLVHRFLVTSTVEESIYKLNRSKNTNLSSFSNRKTKNQDQESLTLKDLESLFTSPAAEAAETEENPEEAQNNLRDLRPSVAAAIAAERRMKESCASSSTTNTS